MAKTVLKQRLLPSLLDRLTDNEPVHRSIELHEKSIQKIQRELGDLTENKASLTAEEHARRASLESELDKTRMQYLELTALSRSFREVRDCVRRDLDWLFNAQNYSPSEELQHYPEVMRSVVNFGLPDLAGKTVTGMDIANLERMVKQTLLTFEPRILSRSLNVRFVRDESAQQRNALTFEIDGELWSEPLPIHLRLITELELEDGGALITEFHA